MVGLGKHAALRMLTFAMHGGVPSAGQTWQDGKNIDPELLAAKKVRVKVEGMGEGVVQEFHKSKFCTLTRPTHYVD